MKRRRFPLVTGILFLVMTCLLKPSMSPAQDTTPIYSQLGKGNSALQFQINQNFSLKSFSGTLLSFQKVLSQRNAIRWGLSLTGAFANEQVNLDTRAKSGNINATVSMNYLWYAHLQRRIRFYYGLGPRLLFGYQNNWQNGDSGSLVGRTITTNEGIGIEGVAGVEWFVNRHISLTAEYLELVEGQRIFSINKHDIGSTGSDIRSTRTSTMISVRAEPVRFGISIYF